MPNKYYEVCQDDFEALPFYSDMDEGWNGHSLIIEEQFKDDFIAEQVARFTRHLLEIMYEMPTRDECNRIASKNGTSNTDDMKPCCPYCEFEFETEKEEE